MELRDPALRNFARAVLASDFEVMRCPAISTMYERSIAFQVAFKDENI